jgi:hypothetical protein
MKTLVAASLDVAGHGRPRHGAASLAHVQANQRGMARLTSA